MRKIADFFATLAILTSLAILAVWFSADLEEEYRGKVVVLDGDSINLDGKKFRLEGIDAPEYDQICIKNGAQYACGKQSKEYLKHLILNANVQCNAWQRDKYQRLLGRCFAGSVFLNEQMVIAGWAVSYGGFHGQEKQAQKLRAGMWAGEFMRPREWRLSAAKSVDQTAKASQGRWWKFW